MSPEETLSKGERTRQAVLDAAYELFLQQGFAATSMRQLADRAGIALGGVYNHFGSKDEIFQALVIEKHPLLQFLPVLQRAPGNTMEEFIRNASRLARAELGEHPEFIKLMFIEIVEFNGKHFPQVLEVIFPRVYPLVQRFIAPENGMRSDIPTAKLLRAFIGNILAYYVTDFLLKDATIPPGISDMSLEDFMDIFLHGVLDPDASNIGASAGKNQDA